MSPPVSRPQLLSIVCPVFNEEVCVPLFYERLVAALAELPEDLDWELIFCNNRSTDHTAERVAALREADPRVQLLTLSRNVGYQNSVQAGLKQASGDAMVVIDVDCEDPPELIPEFVSLWRQGADIVYGERRGRPEPAPITWARLLFYRINRLLADSDIILDMAEFALITAEVRDLLMQQRNTFTFLRAEIAHVGFERVAVPFDRQARIAGKTHYNLLGMTTFAVAGILSSTTFPLRLALYLLPLVFLADLVLVVAGLLGLAQAQLLLVALSLAYLCLVAAFISLFLARTYRNVIARPNAAVDWRLSALNQPPQRSPNRVPPLWPER